MSDLIKNLKQNIIPFQKVLFENTIFIIDTIFESNNCSEENDSSEELYSDDFESESDNNDIITDVDTPKQITFDNTEIPIIPSSTIEDNKVIIQNITIDNDLNENLLTKNLLVLTNLNINQKLYINYFNVKSKLNFEIVLDNSFFPQFSRWYYSQSRMNTISAIDNLIDITIEQIKLYKTYNNFDLLNKYNDLLKKTLDGLINLKKTYESDSDYSYKITKIMNKIMMFN